MANSTRRFFLQTLLALPLIACSNNTGQSGNYNNSIIAHFNLPLPVESLDLESRLKYRKKAEDFYHKHSSQNKFIEQFERIELEQFKNDQIVFLDGMAISHLMAGLILMAKSL